MSRAYLRLDPMCYERKVVDQGYPLPLFAAFMAALCLAEHQPQRGVFRDEKVARALLGPAGRHVGELIARGDLVARDGHLYVDGWDEWQEGDWKVGERVGRIRNRAKRTATTVTPVTSETVYTPSDGDRLSVIDGGGAGGAVAIPPPPAERGHRKAGTNPRSKGTAPRDTGENPRANGTSPRQERESYKRGPTKLHEILTAIQTKAGDPA